MRTIGMLELNDKFVLSEPEMKQIEGGRDVFWDFFGGGGRG